MKQLTQLIVPLLFGVAFMFINSLPARSAETSHVLATVDGENITQQMFDTYVKRRGVKEMNKLSSQDKKAIVKELINRELLYQVALKDNLNENSAVTTELNNIQRNLFAAAAIRQAVTSQGQITEEMLRTEFDKFIKNTPSKEYKARHILNKNEKDAKEVILELDKGANFAELAKKKSTGPAGKNGGDLGWFRNNQMLPEFTNAVVKLNKGKYSKTPVETQYGWHVILLEDVRDTPPPTFEEMKNEIRAGLSNKQVGKYIESLKTNAKIKIN